MGRKIGGFVLLLVAVVFLSLTYVTLSHADSGQEKSSCKTELTEAITELLKKNVDVKDGARTTSILELQLELTTAKIAKRVLAQGNRTIEGYIKKRTETLKKLDENETRKNLVSLYIRYGQVTDLEIAEAKLAELKTDTEKKEALTRLRKEQAEKEIDQTIVKAKKASYFRPSLRFKNREVSAMLLADQLAGNSEFEASDIAIVWLRSRLSEIVEQQSGRGSVRANLQEVSTHVARLTGIAGTQGLSSKEVEARMDAFQTALDSEFERLVGLVGDKISKDCAQLATCKDCQDRKGLQAGVLQSVMSKAAVSIDQDPKVIDQLLGEYRERIKSVDPEIEGEGIGKLPPR